MAAEKARAINLKKKYHTCYDWLYHKLTIQKFCHSMIQINFNLSLIKWLYNTYAVVYSNRQINQARKEHGNKHKRNE